MGRKARETSSESTIAQDPESPQLDILIPGRPLPTAMPWLWPTLARMAAPGESLRWLVDFIQRDLTAMPDGARHDLGTEALAFATTQPIESAVLYVPDEFEPPELGALVLRPSLAVLRSLQTKVRHGLDTFGAGKEWEISAVTSSAVLMNTDIRIDGNRVYSIKLPTPIPRTIYKGPLSATFLARARDVVVEAWPIPHCPREGCGRWFAPTGRQRYCSSRCAQEVRWTRFVAAHPHRTRDYHAEYRRRKTAARRRTRRGRVPAERLG